MPILWQPCEQRTSAPAVLTSSCFREQGAHAVAYALTCNRVSRPHAAPPARARACARNLHKWQPTSTNGAAKDGGRPRRRRQCACLSLQLSTSWVHRGAPMTQEVLCGEPRGVWPESVVLIRFVVRELEAAVLAVFVVLCVVLCVSCAGRLCGATCTICTQVYADTCCERQVLSQVRLSSCGISDDCVGSMLELAGSVGNLVELDLGNNGSCQRSTLLLNPHRR